MSKKSIHPVVDKVKYKHEGMTLLCNIILINIDGGSVTFDLYAIVSEKIFRDVHPYEIIQIIDEN